MDHFLTFTVLRSYAIDRQGEILNRLPYEIILSWKLTKLFVEDLHCPAASEVNPLIVRSPSETFLFWKHLRLAYLLLLIQPKCYIYKDEWIKTLMPDLPYVTWYKMKASSRYLSTTAVSKKKSHKIFQAWNKKLIKMMRNQTGSKVSK
jgi:hypothetical protein